MRTLRGSCAFWDSLTAITRTGISRRSWRLHLQMHLDDNLGFDTTTEEARRQALIKLGGVEATTRLSRAHRLRLRTWCPMISSTMRHIDPSIATFDGATIDLRIHDSQPAYLHRASTWLVCSFAVLARLPGVIGRYGVIAFSVSPTHA
jgi:hypothetical protein